MVQKLLRSVPSVNTSAVRHTINLQRSLLISKDHLPKRGSVAISAPIKVFRLDWDRFKNLSDTERSTFNSGVFQQVNVTSMHQRTNINKYLTDH